MSPQGSYQAGHQSSLDGAVRLASVRRCAAPDLVYNLRVAGNNDYYANGILTHNCQIIDDPLNAKDQFSDAKLEECKFWLDNVMSSRFNDSAKGARVIIMQRLSERDLSGHVIAQGGYEHLCLPSEFEPERRCVTSTGWTDPRTEYGELMFEQLFPREVIEKAKVELATYGFAGQHQQRPAPLTGGIWKNYWWRYWKPANVDLPPVSVRTEDGTVMEIIAQDLPDAFDEEMLSFDCSFKDLNESDYVAGGHWGRKGVFKYLLLDSIHARLSFTATVEAFKQMCARNPKASTKLVEDKANGTAVIDTLKGKISGIIPVNPEGGKVARRTAWRRTSKAVVCTCRIRLWLRGSIR